MIIVNPNAQYLDPDNFASPYAFIEKIGRICYKSEDKITDDSAVAFFKMLSDRSHNAMLEHAHIILAVSSYAADRIVSALDMAYESRNNPAEYSDLTKYFNITLSGRDISYISASLRVFISLFSNEHLMNNAYIRAMYAVISKELPDLTYSIQKSGINLNGDASRSADIHILTRKEFISHVKDNFNESNADLIIKKHMTHTVLFTCDRGVSHEIVRHRPVSYAMESTRYCNYSKNKFGNTITVCKPLFWAENDPNYEKWKTGCENTEKAYLDLIAANATPQEARSVLPHSVKTDIAVTATENEWVHILNLRYRGTTGSPHPQMKEVMTIAYNDLVKYSDNRLG